jgi:hypothetical protein
MARKSRFYEARNDYRNALPTPIAITVDEWLARRAAVEFVETAFADALDFWADNEPDGDDEGRPIGEVQTEMPHEARSSRLRTPSRSRGTRGIRDNDPRPEPAVEPIG